MSWRILWLFIIVMSLAGQDLRRVWEDYMSLDTELAGALQKERILLEQQNELEQEIQTLRDNQSWYNGWINEMRLVGKSAAQVELSDSLMAIRSTITDLSARRDGAFGVLKGTYQQVIMESEEGKNLSPIDKATAISLGRWIITRNDLPVDLPDYSSIMKSAFENETVRRMVLGDLHSLLLLKLTVIDSLLSDRLSTRELAVRLEEFHRDLGLQAESDLDLGSAEPRSALFGPSDEDLGFANLDGQVTGTLDGTSSERRQKAGLDASTFQNPLSPEKRLDSEPGLESVERDIDLLNVKRHQYQELLRQIEKELVH